MAQTSCVDISNEKIDRTLNARVQEWLAQQCTYAKRIGNQGRVDAIHRTRQKWGDRKIPDRFVAER